MIQAIHKLTQIEQQAKNAQIGMNSTLPLSIKVLDLVGVNRYLLQIGREQISTRSEKPLEIGAMYWGELSHGRNGVMNLGSMVKKPHFLQYSKPPIYVSEKMVGVIFEEPERIKEYKEQLVRSLGDSKTKDEFYYLSNLLNSLGDGVVSLPYFFQDTYNIVQYRYKKGKTSKENSKHSIDFFATFDNLGGVKGVISMIDEEQITLNLTVMYPKTKDILESNRRELDGFESVYIAFSPVVEPLYQFRERLFEVVA